MWRSQHLYFISFWKYIKFGWGVIGLVWIIPNVITSGTHCFRINLMQTEPWSTVHYYSTSVLHDTCSCRCSTVRRKLGTTAQITSPFNTVLTLRGLPLYDHHWCSQTTTKIYSNLYTCATGVSCTCSVSWCTSQCDLKRNKNVFVFIEWVWQ